MTFDPNGVRKAMSNAAAASDPIAEIEAKCTIDGDDVLQLRRMVHNQPAIDPGHADLLLHFEKHCHTKVPVWQDFYVDTLTDYFVWQTDPPRRLGVKSAKQLLEYSVQDDRVAGLADLELLISIAHWGAYCPERVAHLVLQSVHDSVLTPDTALYGHERTPGVITAADVHLMRRTLYIGSYGSGYSVTSRQAELLFDLNDASDDAENHEDWREFFVKAIGSHLMYPDGFEKGPIPEDFKTRDEWAEESRGVGLLLMDFGQDERRTTFRKGCARSTSSAAMPRAAKNSARNAGSATRSCWKPSRKSPRDGCWTGLPGPTR
jgi:hypothetical protein